MSNQRPLRPARFAMPAVALVAAALLAGGGAQAKVDHELAASLLQPVAQVETQAVTVAPGSRAGATGTAGISTRATGWISEAVSS